MKEIFKPVPGYEGLYSISDRGMLKTHKRQGTDDRIITGFKDRTGYLRTTLMKDGVAQSFAIHRIVCLTFLENPEGKRTVNHKNGDKTDNRLENLEWMTHSENHSHAYKHLGRKSYMSGKAGVLHPNAKSVTRICKTTGEVLVYPTLREAANSSTTTSFCEGHISSCCHGKRNSHKGFYWKFTDNFPNPEPRLQALLDLRQ